MQSARLVVLLACVSCVDRPAPVETDTADATTTGTASDGGTGTTGSTDTGTTAEDSTGEPTGGTTEWHGLVACVPLLFGPNCPMNTLCCSDDPATVGGKIPNYYMDGANNAEYGPPLFSDENNAYSFWGYCVDTSAFISPLSNGCPVPCDPTWDPAIIAEICGTSVCCPFDEVDPETDCVLDPNTSRWRSVRGSDIPALTDWTGHATRQDPSLASCDTYAAGDQDAFLDCRNQLTVADRRGFCYSVDCPCTEDRCDMLNADWKPRCLP